MDNNQPSLSLRSSNIPDQDYLNWIRELVVSGKLKNDPVVNEVLGEPNNLLLEHQDEIAHMVFNASELLMKFSQFRVLYDIAVETAYQIDGTCYQFVFAITERAPAGETAEKHIVELKIDLAQFSKTKNTNKEI